MRRSILIASVAFAAIQSAAALAVTTINNEGSSSRSRVQADSKASFGATTLAALAAMKGLNAIVLGDWNAGNEVEGKVWVGGSVNQYNGQSKTQVGFGNTSRYSGQSNYATLTVLGDLNTGIDLSNGATKNGTVNTYNGSATGSYGAVIGGNQTEGSNGLGTKDVNAKITIGGDAAGLKLDYNGATVTVNGQLNGANTNFNGSGMTVKAGSYTGGTNSLNGGTTVSISGSNPNGGTPPEGWSFNKSQTLDAPTTSSMSGQKSAMLQNMRDASATFAAIAPTSTATHVDGGSGIYDLLFSVNTASTGDYTVFNVTAADLTGARNLGFQLNGSTKDVIINVTGVGAGDFTWNLNGGVTGQTATWDDSLNSQLLWNFADATSSSTLTFKTDLHGALLAPLSSVESTGVLDGTVVAGTLSNKGEIHLGTFDGQNPDTVPEPATWAMLVLGFGFVGSAIRRRQRQMFGFAPQ